MRLSLVHFKISFAWLGDWDGAGVVLGRDLHLGGGWGRMERCFIARSSFVQLALNRLVNGLLLDANSHRLFHCLFRFSPCLDQHFVMLLHEEVFLDDDLFLFVSDRDLGAVMDGVGSASRSVHRLGRELFFNNDLRFLNRCHFECAAVAASAAYLVENTQRKLVVHPNFRWGWSSVDWKGPSLLLADWEDLCSLCFDVFRVELHQFLLVAQLMLVLLHQNHF